METQSKYSKLLSFSVEKKLATPDVDSFRKNNLHEEFQNSMTLLSHMPEGTNSIPTFWATIGSNYQLKESIFWINTSIKGINLIQSRVSAQLFQHITTHLMQLMLDVEFWPPNLPNLFNQITQSTQPFDTKISSSAIINLLSWY